MWDGADGVECGVSIALWQRRVSAQLEVCALRIRGADSLEELESLRGEWLVLWRTSKSATPFQSPDWLIPWWKHFDPGRLCVLVLEEGGRLVGIAPFFANEDQRRLRLIGTSNTDYQDVLIDDPAVPEVTAAIFAYLCQQRRWDVIDLENLRPGSPLLTANTCAEFVEHVRQQDSCPVVSLPPSVDQFLNTLPRQLVHNLNYYRRRLASFGDVAIDCADENNFDELFEAFMRLHEARWHMNNMSGMLCDERVQRFLREAGQGLLSNGALRLYGLRIDERIVASLYGFHHARRTYYYLGGFDPELKQYSVGTILVAHAINEAMRERATEFDFLRGRERYKYRWGAVDEPIYHKRLSKR